MPSTSGNKSICGSSACRSFASSRVKRMYGGSLAGGGGADAVGLSALLRCGALRCPVGTERATASSSSESLNFSLSHLL